MAPTHWRESPTGWRTSPRPRGWKALARQILTRDPSCTLRTRCAGAPSTEVDHIGDPEDHDPDNLRGVCADCHRRRTAMQGVAARKAKATGRRGEQKHPGLID